jgi:hypothetical protein
MNSPHDPNVTADISSVPADSIDAGVAAGFRQGMHGPQSSLGGLRPVLLKAADGESAYLVRPKSDAMPPKDATGDRYRLDGEIARGGMGAVLRGRDVSWLPPNQCARSRSFHGCPPTNAREADRLGPRPAAK